MNAVESACSDFTGGCARAYELAHGAVKNDEYANDCSAWSPKAKCLLKGCVDHMIKNCVGPCKTGMRKLKKCASHPKNEVANLMRSRLELSARRMGIVAFDAFWYFTLHELTETGTIQAFGFQRKWAKYFKKAYLFLEEVGGVQLFNAIWRNGPDRRQPRASDNIAESYHNKLKAKLKALVKALLPEQSANARPSLPELIPRLEHAIEIDDQFNTRHKEQVLHRVTVTVDANLLTGHPSIYRWSNRLAAKDFLQAWKQDKSYIQRIDSPPYRYFVMSFGRTKKDNQHGDLDKGRMPSRLISASKARNMIGYLTLQPREDRNRPRLTAKDGDHLSRIALTNVYEDHAVVRVDLRLVAQCAEQKHLRIDAVTCMTTCDQYLNHYVCEHCITARYFMDDPLSNPFPSAIASASNVDGQRGRRPERVLGNARMSEDAAENLGSRKRKRNADTSAQRGRKLLQNPPRDPQAEIEAQETRQHLEELKAMCKTLTLSVSNSVRVQREGKLPLTLRDSVTAHRSLRKLLAGLEQAHLFHRRRMWQWRAMIESLQLVGILRGYKHHPAAIVSAAADLIMDRLRSYLSDQSNDEPAHSLNTNRCSDQTGYPTIQVPEGCLGALRGQVCSGNAPRLCWLVGKQVEHGYAIIRILQISQVVGDNDSIQSTPPPTIATHLNNHAVRLLGNSSNHLHIENGFTSFP